MTQRSRGLLKESLNTERLKLSIIITHHNLIHYLYSSLNSTNICSPTQQISLYIHRKFSNIYSHSSSFFLFFQNHISFSFILFPFPSFSKRLKKNIVWICVCKYICMCACMYVDTCVWINTISSWRFDFRYQPIELICKKIEVLSALNLRSLEQT